MRYQSFRIQNFRGIKDTTVQLQTVAGASVFAFVGLNESGKTTVLEAIHSFAPDEGTRELIGEGDRDKGSFKSLVPRHQLSEFTGKISVTATLTISADDKVTFASDLSRQHKLEVDVDALPNVVVS